MALLDRSGVLKGGRLRDDVHLISVGDHFDYDLRIPDIARGEGLARCAGSPRRRT
ncbi:MAG: hypothetical protein R3A52_23725 [Polyangiales bacterium]